MGSLNYQVADMRCLIFNKGKYRILKIQSLKKGIIRI